MLRDVVELRENKWVPRGEEHYNPKTINQIHKEAHLEKMREQKRTNVGQGNIRWPQYDTVSYTACYDQLMFIFEWIEFDVIFFLLDDTQHVRSQQGLRMQVRSVIWRILKPNEQTFKFLRCFVKNVLLWVNWL